MRLSVSQARYNYLISLALLLSALPFLLNLKRFQQLFWFGDELHLLSEIRHAGFWTWTFDMFAENFVPLFKLLWGGAAIVFDGSYFAMVCIVWGTHLLNVYLMARLLQQLKLPAIAVFTACVTLGVTYTNIEALCWTVQWSSTFSLTFFLLASILLVKIMYANEHTAVNAALHWWHYAAYLLALVCGVLCFSRGVISCAALVAFILIHWHFSFRRPYKGLWLAALTFLPALVVGLIIVTRSGGNTKQLAGIDYQTFAAMFEFGAYYFLLNPLFRFFNFLQPFQDGVPYLLGLGTLKLAILVWGFYAARNAGRMLTLFLAFLVIFDLSNAAVLGIGRYHEGLNNAVVSRYQYTSLISFVPFLGLITAHALSALKQRMKLYTTAATALLSVWIFIIGTPWHKEMKSWSRWHGRQGRNLILRGKVPRNRLLQHGLWIGLPPIISLEEAQAVAKEFNLH